MVGSFNVGIGTIAGSTLFNVLAIPALSSLVVGGLSVRHSVIKRDGAMYLTVVMVFVALLFFGAEDSNGNDYRIVSAQTGLLAVISYLFYVVYLVWEAIRLQNSIKGKIKKGERFSLGIIGNIVGGMMGVGIACHFLIDFYLKLFTAIGLSVSAAGVTILAVATSIPDTLLSVFVAKRGDHSGAIANAFFSNTFDILVCLVFPVFVLGGAQMNWAESRTILVCLLIATIISVTFMLTDWTLTRTEGAIKIVLYLAFCVAVFSGII